jgi:uncharacterized membrane protein
MRRLVLCLLAIYLSAFIVIFAGTTPWSGGEGAIAWTIYMLLLSAPTGTLVLAVQTFASIHLGDQPWMQQAFQSPIVAALATVAYASLGALQWFVLIPLVGRWTKRFVLRIRGPSKVAEESRQ